jgi:Cdc6-like AAA superfamily ATPase
MNVFSIDHIDIEQLNPSGVAGTVGLILKDLKQLSTTSFYRFINNNRSTILISDDQDPKLHSFKFSEVKDSDLINIYGSSDIHSNIKVGEDYAYINSSYFRFIRIEDFPNTTDLCELQSIGNSVVQFRRIPPEKAKFKLDMARKQNVSSFNEMIRDIKGEASYTQNEELLEKVTFGDEEIYDFEGWIYVSDINLDGLHRKSMEMISSLKRRGFKVRIEDIGLTYALKSFLPNFSPSFPNKTTVYTQFLLNLIPLTEDKLDKKGILYHSKSNNELQFDLFSKDSLFYNAIFIGPPGSGKSFSVGYFCNELIKDGAKILIVDRGGSYKRLCQYHNGHEIKSSFNPLAIKDPYFIHNFLLASIPDAEFSKSDEGRLLKKIKELNLQSINSLKDLLSELDDFTNINYYFEQILQYTDARDLINEDFIYIDIENFPENVLPSLIVYLIQLVESLNGKKVIVLDEVHYLLDRNPSFVETKFRELRKHNGAAIALTQSFDDFYNTKVGRVIANCSYYKFFFNQSIKPNEFIDEWDVANIESIKTIKGMYSEVYLKSDKHRKVLKYYPSALDFALFTTSFDEVNHINNFINENNKFLNFQECIHKIAEVKYV